jgi:hypothetical protein
MSEISADNRAQLEKKYRTTAIIVLAQIAVTLVLIALAWFAVSASALELPPQSLTTLWVAVVFIAIGSFMLRRLFFNWERLKTISILKGVSGLLNSLQLSSIILGALAEIIAVLGFLIANFSGNSSDMLRAGAIALVIFLVNFPRKGLWKNIVANLEKV